MGASQHLAASRLVSRWGWQLDAGSGRYPARRLALGTRLVSALDGTLEQRFDAGLLDGCQAQHLPRSSFLLAGAALQALDGTRARFGAPPL